MNEKARVEVFNGDQTVNLGLGWLVGTETVYVVMGPDVIHSEPDPVFPPDMSVFPDDAKVTTLENNPKFILDSGRTVYGCQVWWQGVTPEENNKAHAMLNAAKPKPYYAKRF